MAAQEYYDPQGYAIRQQSPYAQPHAAPHNTTYQRPQQQQQYHHSAAAQSSQQLPYNLADYKPAYPQNNAVNTPPPQQPPPPYSVLPERQHTYPIPPQHATQYQQSYSPVPNQPQYLAPPQQSQYRPGQQGGAPLKPIRSKSEPAEDRKHRRHRRHSGHNSRRRSRSRSSSRSRSRSRPRSTTQDKKSHSNRNTFLGAGGGALIGDAIFPGLGTVGGAILGGLGGREASNRKSRSASRKERY